MAKKNNDYGYEETVVTLTDEDGVDKDFYIDEIYEVNGKTYCAAIPGDVENVTEYYVFRLKDLGNDDFEMEDIDDEDEYDAAADAYEEKLDARAWSRMNLCLRLLNVYQLLTLASYYFILYTILAFTSSAVFLSLRRSIIAPANSMHVPIPRLVVN